MPPLFDIAFAVIALLAMTANFFEPAPWMMAVKPLPTLWLVLMARRFTREAFGLTLVLGVACGAAGDALLAPERRALFPAGLLAFLVGHLFYIAAFTRRGRLRMSRIGAAAPLIAGSAVLCYHVQRAMSARGEAADFPGVALYMTLLVTMTVTAIVREGGSALVPCGAVIFLVSDAHIAFNNFIFASPGKVLLFSGMATYYLAQYLIVKGCILEGDAGGGRATASRADRGAAQ